MNYKFVLWTEFINMFLLHSYHSFFHRRHFVLILNKFPDTLLFLRLTCELWVMSLPQLCQNQLNQTNGFSDGLMTFVLFVSFNSTRNTIRIQNCSCLWKCSQKVIHVTYVCNCSELGKIWNFSSFFFLILNCCEHMTLWRTQKEYMVITYLYF